MASFAAEADAVGWWTLFHGASTPRYRAAASAKVDRICRGASAISKRCFEACLCTTRLSLSPEFAFRKLFHHHLPHHLRFTRLEVEQVHTCGQGAHVYDACAYACVGA
jgi:hypothetical protein